MDFDRRDWFKLSAIALAWLLLARLMATRAAALLPESLARQLTLHSFLSAVLISSTALGVGAGFVLLSKPRAALGLARPAASAWLHGALWAPVVLAVSLFVGFELALPTLLRELAEGGRQAVQRNTGGFGRALVQSYWLTTVLWATVLTPVAEELLFRGAMWSAVARLTQPIASRPRSLPAELLDPGPLGRGASALWGFFLRGGLATLATAAVFAALHADQSGGAGIVRVAQAACLGLALGLTRQWTGSIGPGVLLHGLFNLLTLAKLRRWIVTGVWPAPLPIPLWYWLLAAGCLVVLALWWAARWWASRRQ